MFFRLASVQEQRLPDARLSPTNEDNTPPITPTSSAKVLHRWHDKCRVYFSIFLWLGCKQKKINNNNYIIIYYIISFCGGGSSCHNNNILLYSFHIRIFNPQSFAGLAELYRNINSFVLFFFIIIVIIQ